ncbi:transmembrane amino acid transporter protein-domain-containing protein [Coniella lustricola]|uniref:Transmembrane amino acid transporter protein-domain-containing protein n=1 Tax=Coniella lustricola TaxID=2025994 RepID=A0A2T3AB90_9PEZI|nr:transmembrane amino acid transporter protein-domain-containing protein [Coniella lustricola]
MSRERSHPSPWDSYERGNSPNRYGSFSTSDARHIAFEDHDYLGQSPRPAGGEDAEGHVTSRRRRRSSVTNRLAALGDIGGVNSIRSWQRSFQRASAFAEVIPQRPSFIFAPDQEPLAAHDGFSHGLQDQDTTPGTSVPRVSLLRQHLEASSPEHAIRDDGSEAPGPSESQPLLSHIDRHSSVSGSIRDRERKPLDNELRRTFSFSSNGTPTSIFAVPPHLATPEIVGSYGSHREYGSISAGDEDLGRASMAEAGELWRQQQVNGNIPDGEMEPILVKEVEQEDGKIVLTVKGQSTLPQTIFNSINVLIGVGLLSLPMGIKYAGWLCGMVILLGAAAVTSYTATLLAKCMDLDPSLITFSDLAYISFGRNARVATSILFTLELLAACVALIVLFADSMDLLFEGVLSLNQWKIIFSAVLVPLNFLPLRYLSFTSIIGIACCFTIVLIVIIDGFIKPESPGSLITPAVTYLFPANWLTLPLSFGLLMSPWGGHGVFPNIYRDMRHPHKYGRAVKITFSFTCLLDATAAVAGLLMFGDDVLDAITSNIFLTAGYPKALTYILCGVIAIIPLTKVPLNARPIIATAEVILGVHQQSIAEGSSVMVGRSAYFRGVLKIVIRVVTVLIFLVISILFPAFDSIMAFMGSALCFTICVTLPIAFHLKLFGQHISKTEKVVNWVLMLICICLSVVGTVWAFLPKSLIQAE